MSLGRRSIIGSVACAVLLAGSGLRALGVPIHLGEAQESRESEQLTEPLVREPPPGVTEVTRGIFSPDGRTIAVIGTDRRLVGRVGLLAQEKVRWITSPSWFVDDVAWLPGSRRMIVAYRPSPTATETSRMAIIDLDGAREFVTRLVTPLRLTAGMAVSPNGKIVLIAASRYDDLAFHTDIFRASLTTGVLKDLTNTPNMNERAPSFFSNSGIAYAFQKLPGTTPDGYIATTTIGTHKSRVLTSGRSVAGWASARPGGTEVVYDATFPGNKHALWAVTTRGRRRPIASVSASYPSVRSDGRAILFKEIASTGVGLRIMHRRVS